MLLQKYEPKNARYILENNTQVMSIVNWLGSWKKGNSMIVCGPTGCGKNLAMKLIAKELNYELVESELDGKNIQNLASASLQGSVFLKKKIILLEDIELVRSKSSVARLIENSAHPVVILAQNPYDIDMPAVVKKSKIVKFAKISDGTMEKFLTDVCRKEDIRLDKALLQAVIESSRGDVRAALIDLELMSFSAARDRSYNIFELMKAIFVGDRKNARKMLEDYHEFDGLFSWIGENIQKEYRNLEDTANAYDYLSKADLVRARILKRQSWNLQKYFIDMFIYGLSSKRRVSIAAYAPPQRFRRIDGIVLEKIGRGIHTSKKDAARHIGIIKMFIDDEEFCRAIGFDEDDAEILRNLG